MANIPEIKIGGVTYDLKDKRLDYHLSELADTRKAVNDLNAYIDGEKKLDFNLRAGVVYVDATGYTNGTRYAVADMFLEPYKRYSLSGLSEMGTSGTPTYQYTVVYYNSDTSGTTYYAWGAANREIIVGNKRAKISFRRSDLAALTDADIETIQKYFVIKIINRPSGSTYRMCDYISTYDRCFKETISVKLGLYSTAGFNWATDKYCIMDRPLKGGVRYRLPQPPTGMQSAVTLYDSDSSGTAGLAWGYTGKSYRPPRDAYLCFRKTDGTAFTAAQMDQIMRISTLGVYYDPTITSTHTYVSGVSPTVLKGAYFPDLTGWSLYSIRAESTSFRFVIKLSDGTLIYNGQDDVGTSYSDAVQKCINPATGEILGYYVLHWPGEDYVLSQQTLTPYTYMTDNISANPIIEEFLNRTENLVLLGDSIFGYKNENMLTQLLAKISNKTVYNCGFGGCKMAQSATASGYDAFCFANIADAIDSGNYATQLAQIGLNNIFPYRYADLKSISWSKPTTVFVNFINNDFNGAVPIGDPWNDGETATDWNKKTFLGAMTYGLYKIITKYPKTRFVFFTGKWRYIGGEPPYAHVNANNQRIYDYNDALKENASRIGVSVFDFTEHDVANAFNKDVMMISAAAQGGGSHYTRTGYERFAKLLNALDRSPMY